MTRLATPIPPDEIAWAVECALAGDTLADIAEGSDRPREQWDSALAVAGVACLRPLDDWRLDDQDAIIAQRYVDGVTFERIGRELGCSRTWAQIRARRLLEAGVMRQRPRMRGPWTVETRAAVAELLRSRARAGLAQFYPTRNAKALALVRSGLSYGEAGRRVHLSRGAVAGIVHRARKRETAPSP